MDATVADLMQLMENIAPPALAEHWDSVGLMVGDASRRVTKVLIALDATAKVVDEAIKMGCECIITHHPFIHAPLERITLDQSIGRKISSIMKNDISIFSAHTNLDKVDGGVNDCLCKRLMLREVVTHKDADGNNSFIRTAKPPQHIHTAREMAEHAKNQLQAEYVMAVGPLDNQIERIALAAGSAMNMWPEALAAGADLFITGDIKYHDALEALEAGLRVLDVSHYAGEAIIVVELKQMLERARDDAGLRFEVLSAGSGSNPITLAAAKQEE